MNLVVLLDRAGISRYERGTWFQGVQLRGLELHVPTEWQAATIRRCYLPQLQDHLSDLTVRVVAPAPVVNKPSQAAGLFKAQPARDLLGE